MSLTNILKIIRDLNSGSIIPDIHDEVSFCDLGSESINLYLGKGDKYYYFSEYKVEGKADNMSAIEQIILYNKKDNHYVKPDPQNAYLVLFYQVDRIDEQVLKKVIDIEENEYFYKRYVFYYTPEELNCFEKWYEGQENKTVNDLINSSTVADNMNCEYIRFLLRLLVKIPYIKFNFKNAELKDFDNNLSSNILRMRNSESISMLNGDISKFLELSKYEIDKAVEMFYKAKVGE